MGAMSIPGITIDGPTSRDLDDAIWVEGHQGGFLLYVSIANVAGTISVGGNVDKKALERGFTRYYSGKRNDPMLPFRYSEASLSLLPRTERSTLTLAISISAEGELGTYEVMQTQLNNRGRYSYHQVAELLANGGDDPHLPMLRQARNLAQLLLNRRRAEGALAFYDLRRGWETTEEGFYRKTPPNEANVAHVIVQECMIACNTAMARYAMEKGIPVLFRNHRASQVVPEREKLLEDISSAMATGTRSLETLFARINLVLQPASYGVVLEGHYGLSLPAYLHTTSPLRRFPDLANQRQFFAALRGDALPYDANNLAEIATQVNLTEREIKAAKGRHLKAVDEAKVSADLERKEEFGDMPDDRFYKILALAATMEELPQPLIDAAMERLSNGWFGSRELFILLVRLAPSEELKELQSAAVDWLSKNPIHAPSVLSTAMNSCGWEAVSYTDRQVSNGIGWDFFSIATTRIGEDTVVSSEVQAGSIKLAHQRAAADLLAGRIGYQSAFKEPEKKPLSLGSPGTGSSIDYKSYLNQICQRRASWSELQYQGESYGTPHEPVFVATVSVTVDGSVHQARGGQATTKKLAEQSAAEQLLRSLNAL